MATRKTKTASSSLSSLTRKRRPTTETKTKNPKKISSKKIINLPIADRVGPFPVSTKGGVSGSSFSQLAAADQKRIALAIGRAARSINAKAIYTSGYRPNGYNVVKGPGQNNRPYQMAEIGGEDTVLNQSERNRIIAMARNLARNSEQLEGMLHQFEINVVGVDGGKAIFSLGEGYEEAEDLLREKFAAWAASAEFFDDLSLQRLLKLALRTQILGGNLVLVFDDSMVEDSGKIICFEPDCIGNVAEGEFKAVFPDLTESQGIIKTANSRTIGVIVSWSQRGQSEYKWHNADGSLAAWPLIKPAGLSWIESPFIIHRSPGRFNQGHGYSGLWSALATLADLTDVQSFEVQAAKKNSQTIGQVTQATSEPEADLAAELDPDVNTAIDDDDSATTDDDDTDDCTRALEIDAIRSAECIYDVMPPGVKMELLDTKHPNSNMPLFIKWLQGSAAWSKGLGAVYAHGEANSSYTAAQAEMLLTQKTFDEEWHNLEAGILDWVIPHWFAYAVRHGDIPSNLKLPANWMRSCVKWQRPAKRAINPVDEQNAYNSGLKNGTKLYRDFYGPDWQHKLMEFADEVKFCQAHGIPHLALQTVSGQMIETQKEEKPNG